MVKREGTFDTQHAAPSRVTLAELVFAVTAFAGAFADSEQLTAKIAHKTGMENNLLNIIITNSNVKVKEKC